VSAIPRHLPRRQLHDAVLVFVNWLLTWPSHRLRIAVLSRIVDADIGPRCSIERGVRVLSRRGLTVGDRTIVNRGVLLDGRGGLHIGSNVNISPEALLLTSDHDPTSPDFADRKRAVVVGDRCWIATRAVILPGAEIGEGAIVGAGAVVHGTVPARSIVAGNPARRVGVRPDDAQTLLDTYRRFLH
jgi:acetyltransferase-like isoleucine patch superfamily enzyme